MKLSEPPPPFVTFTGWAAGLEPPAVAVNESVDGDTASTGEAGLTLSVTLIVFGDPVAPAAATVTAVVYVPAESPAIDGVTVSVAGADPDAGETLSHDTDSDAVKLSVPPPVLVMLAVCAAGLAPPTVALNVMLVAETASAGVAGLTVSVTSIVFGEPVAPDAATVIVVV